MNAQDLKNSILQLAIQGKLVEQRKEEGMAKELLEQIKAEKEQMIKEGKIKKEKPLPEITEEEIPFEIPESWEWVRLGDVINIVRGASPRPIKEFITESDDGVNWIKIGDTEKGSKYISKTNEKITIEGKKKSRYVKNGDFLLSNSMSFGRPYILSIDGCIHDGWLALSQLIEIFDKEFLYYLLSSSMVYYQFCGRVSGAVVNNLNSDKVKLTVIPILPLQEQKRIVSQIEELMSYVEKYGEAHSKLEKFNKKFPEDMQKSVLQYAIHGKLVEQRKDEGTAEELYQQIQEEKARMIKEGKIKKEKPLAEITEEEIPFEIPKIWKWVRFGDVMINRDAERIPLSVSQRESLKKIYDYYGASGVIDKVDNYIFDKKLMLIGEDGANLLTRSKPIAFLAIGKYWVNNHAHVIDCGEYINLEYIMYYINAISLAKYVTGTAQPKMNQANMNGIPVPLPPLEEQKRIVAKIEEILPYCQQLVK